MATTYMKNAVRKHNTTAISHFAARNAKTRSIKAIRKLIREEREEVFEEIGDELKNIFFKYYGKELTDDDFVSFGMVRRFMSPEDIHSLLLK